MVKRLFKYHKNLPVLIEKGVDGNYVVECPVLEGCYSQGKTIDEVLKNIREVIAMVLEAEPLFTAHRVRI